MVKIMESRNRFSRVGPVRTVVFRVGPVFSGSDRFFPGRNGFGPVFSGSDRVGPGRNRVGGFRTRAHPADSASVVPSCVHAAEPQLLALQALQGLIEIGGELFQLVHDDVFVVLLLDLGKFIDDE